MDLMPTRMLGMTAASVSLLGLGGGGLGQNPQITGTPQKPEIRDLAESIIHRALDTGVSYFDTCNGYGESEFILGQVAESRRHEMFISTKCTSPTDSRDRLLRELDQSLSRLRTDRLDLWLIHNLRTYDDVETIFKKQHAVEVFQTAKREGLTRFIGISGHASAGVLCATIDRCIQEGIAPDAVLFSFNVTDCLTGGHGGAFIRRYADTGIGLIAMKVFGSDGAPLLHHHNMNAETALRYVWSHDIATAAVGIHSLEELEENIRMARRFVPMSDEERAWVEARIASAQPVFTLTA